MQFPFHCALRKYGQREFEWKVLYESDSIAELNILEMEAILTYNTLAKNGYNASSGGDRQLGFSDETKKRMSAAAKNRWANNEEKTKLTESLRKGRAANIEKIKEASRAVAKKYLHTPEARAKAGIAIRKSHNTVAYKERKSLETKQWWSTLSKEEKQQRISKFRDAPNRKEQLNKVLQSLEYKAKASEIVRKRLARPFEVLDAKSNEIIKTYTNIIEAANELNAWASNISACLHGKAKTFGSRQYKARFVEKENE